MGGQEFIHRRQPLPVYPFQRSNQGRVEREDPWRVMRLSMKGKWANFWASEKSIHGASRTRCMDCHDGSPPGVRWFRLGRSWETLISPPLVPVVSLPELVKK